MSERTLKQYRLKAKLSISRLAGLAGVSHQTVINAEKGAPVQEVTAYKIIEALNQQLPANEQIFIETAPISIYRPE
jgi:DNA-binding XRE family transcriptional regulator